MQGKAVVANVIRKETPSTSVVALANASYLNTGRIIPGAQLQYSHTAGARSYDFSIRRDADYDSEMGGADITQSTPGGPAVTTEETRRGSGGTIGVNGAMKLPLMGGDFATNATATQSEYSSGTLYDYESGPQNYASTSRHQNGELGASYEVPLGGTVLGLEMLQRLGHSVSTDLLDDSGANDSYSSLRDTGETITRFTLREPLSDSVTLEGGAEAAYNFLRGKSLYTQGGSVQELPSSNVDVSERRGEAFVQASWQMAKDLMLDTGLRAEYSQLGERGDTILSRSFFYPKPRAVLTWTMAPDSLLRLRAERKVGQLDFGDFVSSANLTQGQVTAGNPDLKPDQRWQYEVAYEYHFWNQGALTLSLMHQDIENILDDRPLDDGTGKLYDVTGNIGDGRSDQVSIDAAVPTGPLLPLLDGGRLSASADWRDSAVTDPLTGQTRRLAYQDVSSYNFSFTQDLADWRSTWSVSYSNGWKEVGYRLAEIDHSLGSPSVSASWNYKPSPELNMNFSVNNLAVASRTRISDYFDGPRDVSPLVSREIENRYARPRLYFNIRKTFD
jgi:outer membrane receptor protein involved in Fe transport